MAAASSKQDDEFDSSFVDNFCCIICNEILQNPVQCQVNEHYFCIECITQHLQNSQTCPTCRDELTLETLKPAPKIIANIVSQIKKPRCSYVSRGCKENVKVEELLLHQQTCDFAPVVCSHEGCKETVNKRDKESHENEACMFRMMTCESCSEQMIYRDFEKHQCTLRKEINEMKVCLSKVNEALKQIMATQTEMQAKLVEHDKAIKNFEDPLHCTTAATIQRGTTVIKGKIFVFGSHDYATNRSIEVFNWATKTWTLVENCLHNGRHRPPVFLYGKKIMIGNGQIEYINPSENGYTSTFSSISCSESSVLYGNRILSFSGGGVYEQALDPPYISKELIKKKTVAVYGSVYRQHNYSDSVQRVGDRIYVAGNSMRLYDVVHNEIKTLPVLPYLLNGAAIVAYKDSLIIIGGVDGSVARDKVYMYNIHSLESKPLPCMRQARAGCAAVIMGDVVVVMGGTSGNPHRGDGTKLKTVEYYVIGDSEWHELPSMHYEREGATACVYV